MAAAGNVSDFGNSWYKKIEKGLVDLNAVSEKFLNGEGLCHKHVDWCYDPSSEYLIQEKIEVNLPTIFTENVKSPLKLEKFINPSNLPGSKTIQTIDNELHGDDAKYFWLL